MASIDQSTVIDDINALADAIFRGFSGAVISRLQGRLQADHQELAKNDPQGAESISNNVSTAMASGASYLQDNPDNGLPATGKNPYFNEKSGAFTRSAGMGQTAVVSPGAGMATPAPEVGIERPDVLNDNTSDVKMYAGGNPNFDESTGQFKDSVVSNNPAGEHHNQPGAGNGTWRGAPKPGNDTNIPENNPWNGGVKPGNPNEDKAYTGGTPDFNESTGQYNNGFAQTPKPEVGIEPPEVLNGNASDGKMYAGGNPNFDESTGKFRGGMGTMPPVKDSMVGTPAVSDSLESQVHSALNGPNSHYARTANNPAPGRMGGTDFAVPTNMLNGGTMAASGSQSDASPTGVPKTINVTDSNTVIGQV